MNHSIYSSNSDTETSPNEGLCKESTGVILTDLFNRSLHEQ